MAKKKHDEGEKLDNPDAPDLTWQEAVDLLPEDEVKGGSEICYFTNEDGNIHSREFPPAFSPVARPIHGRWRASR
jgi:hypothetical protein